MPKSRTLTLEFHTAAHHGSGYGLGGLLDRTVLRDRDGMPYLAGSALKGRFRFAALRLLRATDAEPPICQPAKACGSCLVCRLFGSARQRGHALFEDALPSYPEHIVIDTAIHRLNSEQRFLMGGTEMRASIAMERPRGVALRNHLFSTETVPPLVRFQGEIHGDLTAEEDQLLLDCAAVMTHFGASGARGLGLCEYKIQPAREDL
jgi:CRISPR/Cas system CSM-associated protein Csm3 (group 7 of RAMP superfamily)